MLLVYDLDVQGYCMEAWFVCFGARNETMVRMEKENLVLALSSGGCRKNG